LKEIVRHDEFQGCSSLNFEACELYLGLGVVYYCGPNPHVLFSRLCVGQVVLVAAWYTGNTLYNVYNKKATNMIHAHWFVAAAQLVVGIVWSLLMWGTGLRKTPNLTASDIANCFPIGLCACLAHGGSVLASAVGAVSFAQIVKACEPAFAAVVGVLIPPIDLKPTLAYFMLIPIVGGVGLACIKEGKGVDINVEAFLYASMANAAAALKGKLGSSVTKSLKSDSSKNMDAANVYAVMNIISFICTIPFVVVTELSTLPKVWNEAAAEHGSNALMMNIFLSGICFYFYNEFAFAFTASVGAVTSSVLNTAKRVIIIVVSSIVFQEAMERNTVIGSAIAIGGTFAYSLTSKKAPEAPKKKKE
jgi:solute carrier family 35, member E1